MIAVARAGCRTCLRMQTRDFFELRSEISAISVSGACLPFQPRKLRVQNRPLKFAQAIVPGNHVMLIPDPRRNSPTVVDRTALIRETVIVSRDDSALACS